jgi:NodT family efflux transporter outer membrane factor (OMF) lipoprotein
MISMKYHKFICCVAGAVCLAGCTVGPNYHVPATTMPIAFTPVPASTQPTTANAATRPVDIARWWQSFDDSELNSLVERAVANNLDLDIALTRLQEARTQEVVIEGGALPMVDMSGAAARGSGTNSTKGRVGAPLNAGSNTTGLKEITQVVGFDAGWELDLFGRYRRELEAAHDETQAAMEERNAVLIMVVADVARSYIDVRTLQMRLVLLQDNLRIEQQSVEVVQQRYTLGFTNELDLALAKRELATLQSQLAPLQSNVVVAGRALAVLLGEYPAQITQELNQPGASPQLPDRFQAGLPIELLRRRPDIREAERGVAASTALVGSAMANLFPRVAVTAGVGIQGQGLGRTPAMNSFLWSAGPSAYWPVLDFGELDAMIDIQELRTHEALVNYKKTILDAVQEVDDAISVYASEQDRLRDLSNALVASQRAVTLANQRYNRGLIDYLNVLDAERQLYQLQDQYAIAQEGVVIQFIALYKGLGGGWESYQSIPSIKKPQPAIIATFQRVGSPEDPEK